MLEPTDAMTTDFEAAREGRVVALRVGIHPVIDGAAGDAELLDHVLETQDLDGCNLGRGRGLGTVAGSGVVVCTLASGGGHCVFL